MVSTAIVYPLLISTFYFVLIDRVDIVGSELISDSIAERVYDCLSAAIEHWLVELGYDIVGWLWGP